MTKSFRYSLFLFILLCVGCASLIGGENYSKYPKIVDVSTDFILTMSDGAQINLAYLKVPQPHDERFLDAQNYIKHLMNLAPVTYARAQFDDGFIVYDHSVFKLISEGMSVFAVPKLENTSLNYTLLKNGWAELEVEVQNLKNVAEIKPLLEAVEKLH